MGLASVNIIESGLNSMSNALTVVGNNLANSNTIGFKSSRTLFDDVLSSAMGVPSLQQTPSGVEIQAIQPLFTQGTIENTTNPFNFSITGAGFFTVKNESNGKLFYTRNGEFTLNKDLHIVNPQGLVLQGSSGDITVPLDASGNPPTSVQLTQNGALNATYPSGQVKQVAQLVLAKFNAPTQLANAGNNLFAETDGSGAPQRLIPGSGGAGVVAGNSLEVSNVNTSEEFVNLVALQNAFQANTNVLSSTNEMFTTLISEKA